MDARVGSHGGARAPTGAAESGSGGIAAREHGSIAHSNGNNTSGDSLAPPRSDRSSANPSGSSSTLRRDEDDGKELWAGAAGEDPPQRRSASLSGSSGSVDSFGVVSGTRVPGLQESKASLPGAGGA